MTVRRAGPEEAEAIARVINAAFRPAEEFFVEGDRIGVEGVRKLFAKGTFLVEDEYAGCVYVELRGERAYLGLLSVDPDQQGRGLGKILIAAAEEFAREHGCRFMDIRVVNLRTELPPMYRKLGYAEQGVEPWPEGEPSKLPCHFLCMAKKLPASLEHQSDRV
jgi:GNAT superfamily N-acetyltransferase